MTERENPFRIFVRRYRLDPVRFVQEQFSLTPDPWQADVMMDVARGERAISVRSGHGVGKSAVASWLLLWFLLTRFPCKVVVTAPTSGQLYDALFAEVKHWASMLPKPIQQCLEVKRDRIELKAAPESAFISARTSRAEQPEALQGVHSDNVLLVADEASGVPEPVFQAASGSMSGENATTLLLGNPVRGSGLFFDSHHKLKKRWKTYHVSCIESRLVSDEYVQEQKERYGESSNAYRVRVLGEFPLADEDTVIPLGYVWSARERDIQEPYGLRATWGLDVARKGSNASVLIKRKGPWVDPDIKEWRGLDTMELVGRVFQEWSTTPDSERPIEICVDAIGLGAGVADRLREMGLPIRTINVSELPALNAHLYRNLRAELWYKVREWLSRKDCRIPDNDDLITQLTVVRFKMTVNGKLQIESKDDLQKRGVPSPDMADALCLTFAGMAGRALGGQRIDQNEPIRRAIPGATV